MFYKQKMTQLKHIKIANKKKINNKHLVFLIKTKSYKTRQKDANIVLNLEHNTTFTLKTNRNSNSISSKSRLVYNFVVSYYGLSLLIIL